MTHQIVKNVQKNIVNLPATGNNKL